MTRRNTRSKKIVNQDEVKLKEKFKSSPDDLTENLEQPSLPKFSPANDKQRKAVNYLESGCAAVFLVGSAGTGKSLLSARHGAKQLKSKVINKIYLVRPAVAVGKSLGMLPGTQDEKLAPYFAQTIDHFTKFMGKGFTDYCVRSGIIEYKAVEYLRGTSFENCLVIFEESQNFTEEEMEMLLTRLGENCQFVFTGDTRQHDLRGTSGLAKTMDLLESTLSDNDFLSEEEFNDLDANVAIVEFLPEDVIRSGVTKAFVKMYYHKESK